MTVYKFNESVTPGPAKPNTKTARRMATADVQSAIHGLVSDAVNLVDGELSPLRAKATDYYLGKPFGNEEDGRSQIVITELRDTVHGVMPSLLRIFTGPERVVELAGRNEAKVPQAEQATDYVQYVLMEQNHGFLRIYEVLKDALVRKIGIFKYYWESGETEAHREVGMTENDMLMLAGRDDVEITKVDETPEDELEVGYDTETAPPAVPQAPQTPGAPPPPPPKYYTVEYTVQLAGRPCVVSIPPEEFLFNRQARDPETATMLAHRTRKTRSELVAMGIDEADLDEYGQTDVQLAVNVEAVERNENVNIQLGSDPPSGESNDLITYVEAYVFLDEDGDGKNELRKVCTIGPSYQVVSDEPASHRPFCIACLIPEPHTMIGQGFDDLTMDLQLVKSNIARSMNDSLALSIYPRIQFVEGAASVEDILNTEIGAPIRTSAPGMVSAFNHDFTGREAMPVLEYFDGVGESRTGRSKGMAGLDADALQSSTQQAVNAAVTASQEQIEMLARIFAEQTLKPLFKGLYRLLVEHKPAPTLVKLRGQYVNIDVSSWDSDMDVIVNVALGTSDTVRRIATLQDIATKQEEILQTLGPQNPMVTMAQYSATLRKIAELGGERAPSRYFTQVDPNWQPPPPAPPPPTPEQLIAQAQVQSEQIKTQKDLEIKRAELSLKQQAQEFDQDLQIRKMTQDFILRLYATNAQFKSKYTVADLERDSNSDAVALKSAIDIADMAHRHTMERRAQASSDAAAAHDQMMELAAPAQPDNTAGPQDPNDGTQGV